MNKQLTIVGAVIKKDFLSLFPLVLLAAFVQVIDVLVPKLDILPAIAMYIPYVWVFASTLLIFSLFQLDAPASLVDDWLCRPVPKRALLLAKMLLLLAVIYLLRALTMFAVDLALGYSVVESVQEAVLLQMDYQFIAFPLILITAVVTATMIQGLGALLALFVLVLVVPSAFLPEPGPLEPGFADAASVNGMMWMAFAPAKLMALALMSTSFWVVYRHRHILLGRIMLVVSTVVSVATVFVPLAFSWDAVYALQQNVVARDAASLQTVSEHLHLQHAAACFPATTVAALTGDTLYASAREALDVNPWSEEWLEEAGTEGVTFITRVQPLGVPRDLRVKLAYVQASFVDAVSGERIALRPAETIPPGRGQAFNHQWLLPQNELDRLLQGKPALELTYSMSVLKPLSHELQADGIRRKFPGLGYCSATQDTRNNRIAVDCFDAGDRAALVSAELLDVPSSRVESGVPDYAPALVQAPSSRRIELNVGPASLIDSPIVEVTAWEVAGFVDASVTTQGILGNTPATCPLPSSTSLPGTQLTSWKDDSPHTAFYFTVDDGVQLEVLDWGGEGTPLLLIHGLGATAHTWDDIAPLLAQNYRVFALTRRGIGGSSRPDSGYDSATLAHDAARVLDAVNVDKAVMIGSSMGGQELSWLGAEYPERVAGLIYLDAAFDYATEWNEVEVEEPDQMLPPRPPVGPDDLRSYETLLQWMARTRTDPVPEGEMLALYNINNRFLAGNPGVDMLRVDATEAGVKRPRYEAITAPVLALFATPDGPEYFMRPWYDRGDAQLIQTVTNMSTGVLQLKREASAHFAQLVPAAEIKELPGASHGMHMSNLDEVLAEIRRFVAAQVQTPPASVR